MSRPRRRSRVLARFEVALGDHLVEVLLKQEADGFVCERTLVERERVRASERERSAGARMAADPGSPLGRRDEAWRVAARSTQVLPIGGIESFERFARADPSWALARDQWNAMSERLFEELSRGLTVA